MSGAAFIDVEFDTAPERGAPLGDIATTLVSVNDLLRDLGAIAAGAANPAFREVQVVSIEMRSPLTITLSLIGIDDQAVKAFQEICRGVIVTRDERRALDLFLRTHGGEVTDREVERLRGHITTLRNAAVPLRRVIARDQ